MGQLAEYSCQSWAFLVFFRARKGKNLFVVDLDSTPFQIQFCLKEKSK
jgi:hypothetical protein